MAHSEDDVLDWSPTQAFFDSWRPIDLQLKPRYQTWPHILKHVARIFSALILKRCQKNRNLMRHSSINFQQMQKNAFSMLVACTPLSIKKHLFCRASFKAIPWARSFCKWRLILADSRFGCMNLFPLPQNRWTRPRWP
jgi:hypothetical protein